MKHAVKGKKLNSPMIQSTPATSTPIFSYIHLLESISYTLGDSFIYFWINENLFQ